MQHTHKHTYIHTNVNTQNAWMHMGTNHASVYIISSVYVHMYIHASFAVKNDYKFFFLLNYYLEKR